MEHIVNNVTKWETDTNIMSWVWNHETTMMLFYQKKQETSLKIDFFLAFFPLWR